MVCDLYVVVQMPTLVTQSLRSIYFCDNEEYLIAWNASHRLGFNNGVGKEHNVVNLRKFLLCVLANKVKQSCIDGSISGLLSVAFCKQK
jgi:hypothetical protein